LALLLKLIFWIGYKDANWIELAKNCLQLWALVAVLKLQVTLVDRNTGSAANCASNVPFYFYPSLSLCDKFVPS
jgi:hypothetical protein